jgi:hypothetical protein
MSSLSFSNHPRPDLERAQWVSLNGPWRFAFDPRLIGEQQRWHRPEARRSKDLVINVPYPWESLLSGVAAPDYRGAAWYEREITIPEDWSGLKPYLHFGAIDWQARVWLNGQLIAEHDNGYLPFSCDLSPYLQPGETGTLVVRAYDVADAATPVGKQVPQWYTYSSGIWQTVWLEGRAPDHLSAVRITPNLEQEQAEIELSFHISQPGAFLMRLHSPDQAFATLEQSHEFAPGLQHLSLTLPVPSPKLWSPESPYLYSLQIELVPANGQTADQVSTYFGMRKIERACWNEKAYEYILLNGEPVYLRGALDQAFHPNSLHAYPDDETIRSDIQLAKDLGLNMLRCHIKVNDPLYYYWADRLGMLVMYDLPSPAIDTPQMRRSWEATLHGAMARDFNHPSIFSWILFNETWGLEDYCSPTVAPWLQEMYRMTKQLDPTRLVEDNSPCYYDHVDTDINSWHFYLNDYTQVRQHVQRVVDETFPGSCFNYLTKGEYVQGKQPLINSEYAGVSAHMGDRDISWSFKYQTSELRRHAKICGYVYTELTDVEWEHNGFVNYDRSPKFFGYEAFVPDMTVADLNSPDFVGFDAPPCQTLQPGAELSAPIFVSHYGPEMGQSNIRWQLDFVDRFGRQTTVETGTLPVQPQRFDVIDLEPLRLTLPDQAGLATISLKLEDETGQIRCRNYINVEVRNGPSPRMEGAPKGLALRFNPTSFSQSSWTRPVLDSKGAKFAVRGSGWVDYKIALPEAVDPDDLKGLRLCFEASARAGMTKVDWPQQTHGLNYPQTEEKKYPTDLVLMINDVEVGHVRLPDDPADARGVLSHHRDYDPGSYGYLTEIVLDGQHLEQVRSALKRNPTLNIRFVVPANSKYCGGLALYGETLGRYPLDPTIFIEVE